MLLLYFILLFYSFFRGIRGCIRTIKSYKYISNDSTKKIKKAGKKEKTKIKFHILIPVLREQKIVIETIKHFLKIKGNYCLYLITTEKEIFEKKNNNRIPKKYKKLPTTKEIIENHLKQNPQLLKKIKIIHYPQTVGDMAHQLNYVLKKLNNVADKNDFVIVYNADSRVKPNILQKYLNIIRSEKQCNVVLQSALFLSNYNKLSNFLKSIALLQTRWTLAHEIPRVLKTNGKLGFTEGAHVVGHGLCIKYCFIKKIGGFPQDFLNEDLPLGYFIRLNGAKINLLHDLENADTPTTTNNMFNMYRTWFYGVMYYPSYIKKALVNPKFNKLLAITWGIKYSTRGIFWLFLSLVWFLIFILPILANKLIWLPISVISFIIYAPLNFWLIYRLFGKKFKINFEWPPIIWSPATYLTHSFGPWLAVTDLVKSKIFKTKVYKYKTER